MLASTAPGNYSEWKGTRFVTFLRIGDELMKIVGAETDITTSSNAGVGGEAAARRHEAGKLPPGQCQTLTVQRGLDGTMVAKHEEGAVVLSPVFSKGPPNPQHPSGNLGYQANYNSFYAWSSLASYDKLYHSPPTENLLEDTDGL